MKHPGLRMLVLDDHAGRRAALCACLAELGYEAIAAGSWIARRDIEWCAFIDVLIADHDPPRCDGESLVRALRRRAPGLPAILMSPGRSPVDSEIEPVALDALVGAIGAATGRW